MDEPEIVVRKDGPYRIGGRVAIIRAEIVQTDQGEPVAWKDGPEFEPPDEELVELCRCGNSSTKPFCDSTHERIPFDGTEVADRGPISARRQTWEGEDDFVLYDDLSLCSKAGFCRNVRTGVWEMIGEVDDPRVKEGVPPPWWAGARPDVSPAVLPDPEPIEQAFEPSVGVEPNGPYQVGGTSRSSPRTGRRTRVRNRQTLCRCGQSRNKPFCDSSHKIFGFTDPAMPAGSRDRS